MALRRLVIRGSGGQGPVPSAAGSGPPAGTVRGPLFSPRTAGRHRRTPHLHADQRDPPRDGGTTGTCLDSDSRPIALP